MAPKRHHPPISGGDRKALTKKLFQARAMAKIFAERSVEKRRAGEALVREADKLACQLWMERCGAMAAPSIPRRQSIRPSTAASLGWKSNARAAGRRATSISGPTARGDYIRARSREPARLLEVKGGGHAASCYSAPAYAPPAIRAAGGNLALAGRPQIDAISHKGIGIEPCVY
jgi:hypothetical protein